MLLQMGIRMPLQRCYSLQIRKMLTRAVHLRTWRTKGLRLLEPSPKWRHKGLKVQMAHTASLH